MFTLRKPTADSIEMFLRSQAGLGFTYAEVGATAAAPPVGYKVDHNRVRLGNGEDVFQKARTAISNWKQFDLGWLRAYPVDAPVEAGRTVAVLAHAMGMWSLNAARIVYVVEESSDSRWRFGFAYGTLPGHVAMGEERFLVEWDRTDDSVWYDVLAFSRMRHLLMRIGGPVTRRMQRRFGRDSAAAMVRAAEGQC